MNAIHIGPVPFCGVVKAVIRMFTKRWVDKISRMWRNSPGQSQAKEFIVEHLPKFTADLISKDGKTVKALVGNRALFA